MADIDDEIADEEIADEEVDEELADALLAADEEAAAEEDAPVEEEVEEAPADEEEEPAEDDIDVEEHLKDSVEGSFRLKRMLTQDEDGSGKKQKIDPAQAARNLKIKQMLMQWHIPTDVCCKHVMDQMTEADFKVLQTSGFRPNPMDKKCASEQVNKFAIDLRAKNDRIDKQAFKYDCVQSFCIRWKLDLAADKTLRALNHKDLRHVFDTFDGTQGLPEVIQEAEAIDPEEDSDATAAAIPTDPGPFTISRFHRLELIDPLADGAVFGDANLTFSLRLARHRQALGHVGRVIATTFEELATLRERYPEIDQSIGILEEHYAEVYHGVDCTRIAVDTRFEGLAGSLGAVYYNYPHSGAIQGFFDGHPVVNWRHENLMRLFFRALRSFVKPGGCVKVASNGGAIGVHYTYIVGGARENEFVHTETMPFMDWHLHRYGRSYGDRRDVYKRPDAKNNQSYNAQGADRDMVYCFKYTPSGETLGPQGVRLPPTLAVLNGCTDGPFKHLQGASRQKLAKDLHTRFVTEVGGTHVG